MEPPPPARFPRERIVLFAVLALGAVLRLGYAAGADGLFHPDDIHQSLEPAHGVVYGTGLRFWEFERGARPWTLPGVYVVLLGLLKLLGVTAPLGYTLAARLLDAAVAATWPYFAYRIARPLHSPRAGLVAATLTATWYVFVLLAPRALSHTFSVTFALWALGRAVAEPAPELPRDRRRVLVTGLLLGAAFAFRYQEGLAAAGLALYLALRRRAREIPYLVAGACLPALAVGLLDWATWGLPFHSLFDYVHSNLVEGYASVFGRMPWHFYLTRLLALAGAGAVLAGAVVCASRRALLFAAAVGLTALGVHSAIAHKEVRFVLTAVLVLLCLIGCGVAALAARLERVRPRVGTVALGAVLLVWVGASAARARTVTFADFGMYPGQPEMRASPWGFRRDLARAMARTGTRADLCGVAIFPFGHAVSHRIGSTGGYTYLNRAAPIVIGMPPREVRPLVNYVIACPDAEGTTVEFVGLERLEQVGACTVYRRPNPPRCDAGALARASRQWRWRH